MRIDVTKSFLPPQREYGEILNRVWKTRWLTNRGELTLELESKLKDFLQSDNLTLTTNGTLPIQIALKLLPANSEVITTPFSYVATTSTIVWEGLKPVFADIEEQYLTLDPQKIEEAITENTSAILATHVYGNPCDVVAIEEIAKKHNLLVIYDAAHAFGVQYKNKSLISYGDISTCSFHATKIFHTGEGGCWTTPHDKLHEQMMFMHKFGHDGPVEYKGVGINAKISELQSAMGLAVFPYFEAIKESRKTNDFLYKKELQHEKIQMLQIRPETDWNYHYFPVLFETEELCNQVKEVLAKNEIMTRRYFYPSLNNLPYIDAKKSMPVSENIASRVLCLPQYHDLEKVDIIKIASLILKTIRQ